MDPPNVASLSPKLTGRLQPNGLSNRKQELTIPIAELVELHRQEEVYDVVVFGNGNHQEYNLPPSFNLTMGKRFQELINQGVNCTSFEMVAMRGFRYDGIHLDDSMLNRNLAARYLKGILTFHLAYKVTIKHKEALLAKVDQVLGTDLTHRLHYFAPLFRRGVKAAPEVQGYVINSDLKTFENNADDINAKD